MTCQTRRKTYSPFGKHAERAKLSAAFIEPRRTYSASGLLLQVEFRVRSVGLSARCLAATGNSGKKQLIYRLAVWSGGSSDPSTVNIFLSRKWGGAV